MNNFEKSLYSKERFLELYEVLLKQHYGADSAQPLDRWAADPAKLSRFMASVRTTLYTTNNTWNIDSPLVRQAWKMVGMSGKPSYKRLRELA